MEQKKAPKGEIKYKVTLNEEQKEVKRLAYDNQIIIVTGRAGTGKSYLCAQIALDMLFKKQVDQILVTRAAIETGSSLGFLPGALGEKFNPYIEAFKENLYKCYDHLKIDSLIKDEKIKAFPVQFSRGKTISDILVCEESQNLTKHEVLALLTRLDKGNARLIFNGDLEQRDIKEDFNGLSYLIELSKRIPEIKWVKLKQNHRSDLVSKILEYEYSNK